MNDAETRANLLTGLLDNELTPEELKQANDLLIRDSSFREEYEVMRKDLAPLDAMSLYEPGEADLEAFWRLPYSRLVRNAGLFLVIAGYVGLIGVAVVQVLLSNESWSFEKLSLSAIVIGGVVLFGYVLIERVITYRSDPYKEIKR